MKFPPLNQRVFHAILLLALTLLVSSSLPGLAAGANPKNSAAPSYTQEEVIHAGHDIFGNASSGFALAVESVFSKLGRPTAYIIGEEASGAFIAGLRYGEGTLHFKGGGAHKVYWQGPSLGFDFGGNASRTMALVYKLSHIGPFYQSYAGVDGSAYLIGGFSVNFQEKFGVIVVPIRTGLGLRLGVNMGYLKYTRRPTWNPF